MRALRSSAWTGGHGLGALAPDGLLHSPDLVRTWAAGDWLVAEETLLHERRSYADWGDAEVGWGLILPHDPARPAAEPATPDDAPEPIVELTRRRRGVVLRYDLGRPTKLLDPRSGRWLDLAASQTGAAPGRIPFYLLLYGAPQQLPWELQARLGVSRAVGRLDLTGEALANYVAALLDDWRAADADPGQIVVWAADFGGDDITALMRATIAEPLAARLRQNDADGELTVHHIGGPEPATAAALAERLGRYRPALVVTTSHGQTEPLDQPELARAALGLPIDQSRRPVSPAGLLRGWEPGGAIWYAHACCSAGCEAESVYRGLFDPARGVGRVLAALERVGSVTAPLPRALLGARRPLRAFIGHVEPTFNVTLAHEDPETRTLQRATGDLIEALADGLYRRGPLPLGLAFQTTWARHTPAYRHEHQRILRHLRWLGEAAPALTAQLVEQALIKRLIAEDRSSMVILGDPTVTRPLLPSEQR